MPVVYRRDEILLEARGVSLADCQNTFCTYFWHDLDDEETWREL